MTFCLIPSNAMVQDHLTFHSFVMEVDMKEVSRTCLARRNLFVQLGWGIRSREPGVSRRQRREGRESDFSAFVPWAFHFWANHELRGKDVLAFSRVIRSGMNHRWCRVQDPSFFR